MYACPYTLPVLLQGTEGLLVCDDASGHVTYTVTILFGALQLPAGGLAVAGSTFAGAVSLGPGMSVEWQA